MCVLAAFIMSSIIALTAVVYNQHHVEYDDACYVNQCIDDGYQELMEYQHFSIYEVYDPYYLNDEENLVLIPDYDYYMRDHH